MRLAAACCQRLRCVEVNSPSFRHPLPTVKVPSELLQRYWALAQVGQRSGAAAGVRTRPNRVGGMASGPAALVVVVTKPLLEGTPSAQQGAGSDGSEVTSSSCTIKATAKMAPPARKHVREWFCSTSSASQAHGRPFPCLLGGRPWSSSCSYGSGAGAALSVRHIWCIQACSCPHLQGLGPGQAQTAGRGHTATVVAGLLVWPQCRNWAAPVVAPTSSQTCLIRCQTQRMVGSCSRMAPWDAAWPVAAQIAGKAIQQWKPALQWRQSHATKACYTSPTSGGLGVWGMGIPGANVACDGVGLGGCVAVMGAGWGAPPATQSRQAGSSSGVGSSRLLGA